MRLSVVIPVLDDACALQRLLEQFRGFASSAVELIVADGGSRDTSVAVARALADQVVSVEPGRARQMNAGAKVARGEMLWFVHADAGVSEALLGEILHLSPSIKWGRCDVFLAGAEWWCRCIGTLMNWRSRVTGIATGDQGIFVARPLFEQCGGYPIIPLMEDIALSRMLRRGSRPVCVAEPMSVDVRRWRERGVLRTVLLMWWLRLRYFLGACPMVLHRLYYGERR